MWLALLATSTAIAADLPRTGWTATASTFQPGNEPVKVLDGTYTTFWHSRYSPTAAGYPHSITLAFAGQTNSVTGIQYRPRGDGSNHGRIGGWQIYLSTDGTTFPATPVKTGTWANSLATKTIAFTAQDAKALKVVATSPAVAGQVWASAGEISVQGTAGTAGSTAPATAAAAAAAAATGTDTGSD